MNHNCNLEYVIISERAANPGTEPETPVTQNLTLILVVLAAAVVLLIVGIVTVAGVLACRKQPTVVRRQRRSSKPPDEFELSEGGFGEGFHRRSAQYAASLYMPETEERPSRLSGW